MVGDFFVLGIARTKLQATCHIFGWSSVFRRKAIIPTELTFSDVQRPQQLNQARRQRSHRSCPTAPLQQSDPARCSRPSWGFELQSVPDWQFLFSPGWLSRRLPAEGGPGQAQSGLCSVNRAPKDWIKSRLVCSAAAARVPTVSDGGLRTGQGGLACRMAAPATRRLV